MWLSTAPRRRGAEFAREGSKIRSGTKILGQNKNLDKTFERANLAAGTVFPPPVPPKGTVMPFPLGPQGGLREGGGLAEPDPPTPGSQGEGRYPDRVERVIRAKAPLKSAPFLRGAVLRSHGVF